MHCLALLLQCQLWQSCAGKVGALQESYLNLSFPTGDDEESLRCSRCHGLFCSEVSVLQEHCRDNAFSWRAFMRVEIGALGRAPGASV